jgi:erythronate-4-phosphate dehydrogenase
MKVIIDSAIPYIRGIIEPYAEVIYIAGSEITNEVVMDADAIIIRTRTNVDSTLLNNTKVRFIATATIGCDHIDLDYCKEHNIKVYSAPGCNARGVLQWVAATLRHITAKDGCSPQDYMLGVVGVGNVGSLVAKYARHWGFKVMECDPPREEREKGEFYTIEEIAAKCDIITLHTPLDATTHHLIDGDIIKIMRPGATIINASRGKVTDNRAVMESGHRYAFDVWEGEPYLDPEILANAEIATPHIAGYSIQGKANATAACVHALAEFFDIPLKGWYPEGITRTTPRMISWEELCATIPAHYDIIAESNTLKHNASNFEKLRNSYNYREEYF